VTLSCTRVQVFRKFLKIYIRNGASHLKSNLDNLAARASYRATHMHSAVYAVVRCLSVCLSVTFVYCIETTQLIIKQALDCSLELKQLALDCSLYDSSLRTPNMEHKLYL